MVRYAHALAIFQAAQRHQERHRNQNRAKKLLALMRIRITLRERNYLIANVLISPSESLWSVMYEAQDDSAFLVAVSLPVKEFNLLLAAFSRHYIVKSGPGKRGRPAQLISKNNVLACVLHFYMAAAEAKTLCKLFRVPPATLSRVLKHAEAALAKALRDLPAARICWPSFAEQQQWAASVALKEPLIRGCFCFADGKNYAVHAPTSSDLQNAYKNS
ncbi:hypothetical protein ON010_g8765 [Phytophthora cinnamomi]|nr:hypothetical protein ON010_g8765 [Phytophthora cinnamomi]